MSDKEIIERIKAQGIDHARLRSCLDQRDNWGGMVHAFEYLAVLGIVCDAMAAEYQ